MAARVAVVFGVGPGIGGAAALKFASEGYTVALIARNKEKLDTFKEQIEKKGGKAVSVIADGANNDSITAAFKHIRESVGHPEVYFLLCSYQLLSFSHSC
jgi:NAD(P)-dependent dehydrogenase (short-subunit alcohol dehydrogenase family)